MASVMTMAESVPVPKAVKVMAPLTDKERQVEPVPAVVPPVPAMNLLHQSVFNTHRARWTDGRGGSE